MKGRGGRKRIEGSESRESKAEMNLRMSWG